MEEQGEEEEVEEKKGEEEQGEDKGIDPPSPLYND